MEVAQPEGKSNSMINHTGNSSLSFHGKGVSCSHGDDGKVCNEKYSIS
jgi:hypothetical protein